MEAKTIVSELYSEADISINGKQPWDIQIHDDRLYKRLLSQSSLGSGESYMDSW